MKSGLIRPVELASAGIMAGLTVALGVLATALPVFELFLKIAAILPIALVSARFSARTASTAVIASVAVGFGVGGLLTGISLLQYSAIGWLLGALHRRRASLWLTFTSATGLAVLISFAKFAFLIVFKNSRELALDAFRVSLIGYVDVLAKVPGFQGFTDALRSTIHWLLFHWWLWIPAYNFVATTLKILLCAWLLSVVMRRLHLVDVEDRFPAQPSGGFVDPLPLEVVGVSHCYPAQRRAALDRVSLRLDAGEFVVIAGANGSGKSTLASIMAGAPCSAGQVLTPGLLGRGQLGGLAYLSQAADVHVIGTSVKEDVVWGFDLSDPLERRQVLARADSVLAQVGLDKLADASTRHLSGGELQRLALAGALMRCPRIIISDETTAMIDPAGRMLMVQIFRQLASQGVTVVHITHDAREAQNATRLIRMDAGRIVFDGSPQDDEWTRSGGTLTHVSSSRPLPAQHVQASSSSLWVRDLTHVVNFRSPWQRTVLRDLSFIVEPGSCVLITGANGSGKTTLARLMTGLATPTYGRVFLGAKDMWRQVGDVSLSHQFARLQLLRPTVGEDILDAIGTHTSPDSAKVTAMGSTRERRTTRTYDASGLPVFSDEEAATIRAALAAVGLGEDFAYRGIDELSGGQQRRVALAGLIAARPSVLILDEPFAGLDTQSRYLLVDVLSSLRQQGVSLVLISHDDDGLHHVADQHYHLVDGRIEGSSSVSVRVRGPQLAAPVHFAQPLPWGSPVSRLWAGSKILAWAALSTVLAFFPSWFSVACVAGFLFVLTVLGRVPLTAFPRLPLPVWTGLAGGFLGAYISGGFFIFLRLTVVMLLFLWGTVLLLLTTHTHEFTDAMARMMRPLNRWFSCVPLWIHAMTLTVRSVPVLVDQSRALQDTMTIRLYRKSRVTVGQVFAHFVDIVTASLSAAAYRASLMGTAMSMRGGIPPVSVLPVTWHLRDGVLAAVTLCVMVVMVAGQVFVAGVSS